ncbi:DUF1120 domain-containing protein [Collimonas humicola]|uniref:DUF1120 domain-containing protein n=1 Tax=Collimonas humicola TaxID=2825886 RepID=UPI001B8D18DF|nr:DUF1120 domain-containing protein [Collimonas humicola]
MKLKKQGIAAIFTLSAIAAAHAHTSEDLNVTGTIKAPGCKVELSDGGIANFGDIGRNILSATTSTAIGNKQIDVIVACTETTYVAIKISDNKSAEKPATAMTVDFSGSVASALATSYSGNNLLGLGNSSEGKPVGAYALGLAMPTVDGTPATRVAVNLRPDASTGWTNYVTPSAKALAYSSLYPYVGATQGASASLNLPGKIHVFPLVIAASISKSADIPSSENVSLQGSATVEVMFL